METLAPGGSSHLREGEAEQAITGTPGRQDVAGDEGPECRGAPYPAKHGPGQPRSPISDRDVQTTFLAGLKHLIIGGSLRPYLGRHAVEALGAALNVPRCANCAEYA